MRPASTSEDGRRGAWHIVVPWIRSDSGEAESLVLLGAADAVCERCTDDDDADQSCCHLVELQVEQLGGHHGRQSQDRPVGAVVQEGQALQRALPHDQHRQRPHEHRPVAEAHHDRHQKHRDREGTDDTVQ